MEHNTCFSNLRIKTRKEMIQEFGEPVISGTREYWIIGSFKLTYESEMFNHLGQRIPVSRELVELMLGLIDEIRLFDEGFWYCREMITNV